MSVSREHSTELRLLTVYFFSFFRSFHSFLSLVLYFIRSFFSSLFCFFRSFSCRWWCFVRALAFARFIENKWTNACLWMLNFSIVQQLCTRVGWLWWASETQRAHTDTKTKPVRERDCCVRFETATTATELNASSFILPHLTPNRTRRMCVSASASTLLVHISRSPCVPHNITSNDSTTKFIYIETKMCSVCLRAHWVELSWVETPSNHLYTQCRLGIHTHAHTTHTPLT